MGSSRVSRNGRVDAVFNEYRGRFGLETSVDCREADASFTNARNQTRREW